MTVDKSYTPRLSDNYSFVQFNRDVYTLCIDDIQPVKLNVNSITKDLLSQVDGKKTIEELTETFNKTQNLNFTTDEIINIFNKQLLGYGILEGDNTEKIIIKDDYLRLRFTLIPASVVRRITPLFKALFDKRVFTFLFVAGLLFMSISYVLHVDIKEVYANTDPWMFTVFVIITYASLIFHEFGHAAACDRYGAKSGAIGFGFYIMTPVFYSDVTDAWRLKRHERIIVDLGGIYIQLLICVMLTIGFYITGQKMLIYYSFVIGLTFTININPFLRFDGYWTLSDLLKISNLKDKSTQAMGRFFGRVVGINKNLDTGWKSVFLTIYGITRLLFVAAFVLYMVVFNYNSVLYLPNNLYNFIVTLVTDHESITFSFVKDNVASLFIPFIFYVMLIKSLVTEIPKRYFKKKVSHV